MSIRSTIRDFVSKPMVRPWALSAPILVLLFALPVLRPLRHPADISDDESIRLATITALAQHGTLALDSVAHLPADSRELLRVRDHLYADQPPVLAVLLAWPTALMSRFGLSVATNPSLVAYVLTLLGVTLPVACGAALLYRMGRLFELPRPWRAGLAAATVFGSGLISYAVVLNPHAPAAVLLLCSAACMIHVSLSKLPKRGVAWILISGLCAALSATLDPAAGLIAILFFFVIATLRMPIGYRAAGMLLFLIGASGPIALHAAWSRPVVGEIFPGANHARRLLASATFAKNSAPNENQEPDADDVIASGPSRLSVQTQWYLDALGGQHGVLTHFPVLLIGVLGVGAVMHRHWPSFVKSLAAASTIGAMLIIAFYASARTDWHDAMFASRWFVVFLPLLMFWSGAWLRRAHSSLTWSIAGTLLAFSIAVALVGMTEPYPPEGFDRYTATAALHRLIHPPPPGSSAIARTAIAPTTIVPAGIVPAGVAPVSTP